MEHSVEAVGAGVAICVSKRHTFGTDAFLLSDFAHPKRGDLVCDLGTGCGVIPLLWFREDGPKRAVAVDIQQDAIDLLQQSVVRSGLEGKVVPLLGDLRDLEDKLPAGAFDVVTCNPPYNAAGTGVPSASKADLIARHEDQCTIHDVCRAARRLLRFGGRLCLCQLPERLVDVLDALRAHQIEPKRLRMVQQTAASQPWLILVEGKRGAKPHLQTLPPLIMREGEGPSAEMMRIYRYYGKV